MVRQAPLGRQALRTRLRIVSIDGAERLGRYLYFSSDRGGSLNLWRVPINEASGALLGPPEAVTAPSPFVADLTFSSDGRRLAYVSMDVTSNLQQVAFDPSIARTEGVPEWITTGSRNFSRPIPSPQGDSLVFSTRVQTQEDLFLSRTDGTNLHALTNDRARDREARWSPDGRRISFYSDRSGVWELWMINADGTGLKQLTKRPGANTAVWSPDGMRMAFRDVNTNDTLIFEPDKPWDAQELVTLPKRPAPMVPYDWSPDGQKLAFSVSPAGLAVYSFESRRYVEPVRFGEEWMWLPDSRRLVGAADGKIFIVDAESGKSVEILSVQHETLNDPVVSRDGRRLWFTRGSTKGDIWMATLQWRVVACGNTVTRAAVDHSIRATARRAPAASPA